MAKMFSFSSLSTGLPRWFTTPTSTTKGIPLPSVRIHDVEENNEKRARTLKHLLKANHINHSIIHHDNQFHNHAPHILGSAYILGANSEQLGEIYEVESKELEPWQDSPGEISREDWREYLGRREYARAFVDFYEDQLVQHGYDWRDLLEDFLFGGKNPLVNNLTCGLAHPLIHLGYAFELSSRTVAVEALGLVSCFYNEQHKYLDDEKYTKPSEWRSDDLLEILDRMRQDARFDGLTIEEADENLERIMEDEEKESLILEYWNSWDITNPKKQFADSQRAAAALLVGSKIHADRKYDFFLVHLLTASHAVRVLLPMIPTKWHVLLVRQWWLFVISAYLMRSRPEIDLQRIESYDLKSHDWKFVVYEAVSGKYATDAHFVKGCRAMKEAASTWGDDDRFFLKAAVRFAEEFEGWGF